MLLDTVHISTQANISNVEAVEFYAVYADVMVLARELSLMQVKDMAREIRRRDIRGPGGEFVRLEIFAHGALCMAVSGKCYLSLHSHYASANRGACVQNCRRSYIVTDKEEGIEFEIENENIMSAKDLCTIDLLDKIIDSGTRVIKIEGRGRASPQQNVTGKLWTLFMQEPTPKKKLNPGKFSSVLFIIGVFGMDITWGERWVSGVMLMDPKQQRKKYTLQKVSSITINFR